jgi:tRNA G18 (ribose-2'-O)-methylase SpoU
MFCPAARSQRENLDDRPPHRDELCPEPADRIDLAGPVALLIGNEGNGVPQALAELADGAVTIPCPGPVESLNAAA